MYNIRQHFFALGCALGLAACTSEPVAGGSSEETNALSGVLLNEKGVAQSGATIEVRSTRQLPTLLLNKVTIITDTALLDTTDSEGRWSVTLSEYGDYGVIASNDTLLSYQVVNFQGKNVDIRDTLHVGATLSGTIAMTGDSLHTPVQIGLPGTPWAVWSDSLGAFNFKSLPVGDYSFVVYSPDPEHYVSTSYFVAWKPGASAQVLGPLPTSPVPDSGWSTAMALSAYSSSFQWELPVNPEYGLQGWWTFDYYSTVDVGLEFADARGRSGTALAISNSASVTGYQGLGLGLSGASEYAIIEDDRNVLFGATALTVEAWVYLEETPDTSSSPRNLFGKLTTGADTSNSLFSLALVRNACSTQGPAFAFILTDGGGSGLGCAQALVANQKAPVAQWVHVAAVWDGNNATLYQNGVQVAQQARALATLPESTVPVYFGKSDLKFRIDEVRWGTVALRAADILYRYRMLDQSQWVR